MNIDMVEQIAELLRRRHLAAIEYEVAGQSISLVAGSARSDKMPLVIAESTTPAVIPAAVRVQAPGMGFIRLCHPQRQGEGVNSGDSVETGQVVAWLEDDGLLIEVRASQPGVVARILVEEGERVGYAQALIEYR